VITNLQLNSDYESTAKSLVARAPFPFRSPLFARGAFKHGCNSNEQTHTVKLSSLELVPQ